MSAAERLRSAEGQMLACYFSRRPFDAARLGCGWARGMMPPVDQDAADDLVTRYRQISSEISTLPAAGLTPEDQLTCKLMREVIGYEIASLRAGSFRYVISPLPEAGLAAQILLFLPSAALRSAADAEDFARSCAGIPAALERGTAELAAGRRHRQLPVRHLVERSIEQIHRYLATPLADDPYLAACATAELPGSSSLASDLAAVVEKRVRPAFARYARALQEQAWPSARDSDEPGLCWIDGGEEIYRHAVREHTTLAIDPDYLHSLGMRLIGELQQEAAGVAADMGWPRDFGLVRDRLRHDPSLFFGSAADMLAAASTAMNRAALAVPVWITDLPAATCEVRPMSPLEVRNGVLGRYETAPLDRSGPARYWLNTANSSRQPRYEIEALTHHESVPGHHIEMSRNQEAGIASPFRQLISILPYREGWALHMERVADEIGLYTGNEARLGMISFALWRAARLVVDTGLHLRRWTRSEGIGFLCRNTILTQQNIENEVDRYIAHPASALGYMVGCLVIGEMRRKLVTDSASPAQNRRFYGRLLQHGPLTLNCLEATMNIPVAI